MDNLDPELAQIQIIMYGVAQVELFPSGKIVKVILQKHHNFKEGEIYNISNDHSHLVIE
ncbi:hypothetical protein [Limosilactobacillus vaginalis]|uniref:hypothetical protein n=1 Tax=Limosilactobacillus vaginalis TaxID=1633 RepID=UPI0022A9C1B0|nr:hypothetical protein [Limosilactobacillus vaginalis]MCZ2466538.1 hypothetical protein [Limosilactobacillus vaginalis]